MAKGKTLSEIVEEYISAGRIELPVLDKTAIRIQEMMAKGEYDPVAVERLVVSDPALSGSLLRHANSSFFGGIEKVLTVRDAIVRLGVKRVAELVLLSTIGEQYQLSNEIFRDFATRLWRHAVGAGLGAQWLAKKTMANRVQEAFLAGLMHDIGKLLLLRVLDELVRAKTLKFMPSEDLILELLDGLHCSCGEMLLQYWNLPDAYAVVVRAHHDEDYPENETLLSCVRLADLACNRLGIGIGPPSDINLAASIEAQRLRVSEIVLAELEIVLEDAMELAQ